MNVSIYEHHSDFLAARSYQEILNEINKYRNNTAKEGNTSEAVY